MESRLSAWLIVSAVLSLALAPTLPTARANPASFALYGSISPAGWGFTSTTVAQPGPTLKVTPGEAVSLMLASADGATHRFCVDYNGNGVCDAGEPKSPQFSTSTLIPFSFTATTTQGTYTYFCVIHGFAMSGTFAVISPDVSVDVISTSRNFAYSGVTSSNPIQVNVTASNLGLSFENFFVSAKANTTLIGNQTVTIPGGGNILVPFLWNAALLPRGVYILTAQATQVSGETNFANNAITSPSNFTNKFKGDVNGDCRVDIVDLSLVGANFGKTSTTPGFNPATDLNNDLTVNIQDLVIVATSFGQVCH